MINSQFVVGGGKPAIQRNAIFDSLKFILISCVVLGHVLNYSHNSRINLALWNWLYSFEMPLFVFISGYFTKRKSVGETFRGCVRLVETLFIWNIIYCIFNPSMEFSIERLFKPAFAYWYLLCLIIWRFILQIIPLKILKHYVPILLTFVVGLFWGFINIDGGVLSNSRVVAFFPFFMLGAYAREIGLVTRIRENKKIVSYAILVVIPMLLFLYNDTLAPYFNCSRPYIADGGNIQGLMYRLLFYVLSLFQGYALLNIAPNNSLFAKLGEQTMPIYVFHGFVLIVLIKFAGYLNLPMSILFVLFYSVIICVSIIYMGKFVNYKMLLNPISTVIKHFVSNKK
mgnify:CR=1 FL=1